MNNSRRKIMFEEIKNTAVLYGMAIAWGAFTKIKRSADAVTYGALSDAGVV